MSDAVERFEAVLRFAAERQISDVHLKAGQRPLYRRVGLLISRREEPSFDDHALGAVATRLLDAGQAAALDRNVAVTTIYPLVGVGRFRVHVSRQRGGIALAVRVLPPRPPLLRELRLPPAVASFCAVECGLVLLVAGRGQGRSTTAAALVDAINTTSTKARQIATIEAQTEVLFDDKLAWIVQRAVGRDCVSVASAVGDALAADADVLVIDDLADADAVFAAVSAAEAGKLVFAGVTAVDVAAGLRRVEGLVAAEALPQLRARLAPLLLGAVSQRLVPAADGQRRLPAAEVLLACPQLYSVVRAGHDPGALYDLMAASTAAGMQTVDQSLHDMIKARAVTPEIAVAYATRPQELTALRGKGTRPDSGLF
jgi:twitching motility protein PilT